MNYSISRAQEKDKNFLLGLRKITMLSYLENAGILLSEEEHMDRVGSFFDSSYIIEDESNNNIGLLKYQENEEILELIQLQILPEHQGKGIGTEVLTDLITKAKQGRKKLTLKVLKSNPSKSLYERVGLQIVGEDKIEYHMELVG